jgi:hypothetical protein
MHRVTHDFYVKFNPRQKSGNAVACTNAAPMRLHHLICHKGINTWQIIAPRRRNGGGGLITLLPSFITITYGLIVVSLVVVAHHHGRRGMPPSDLHGKCKPSSSSPNHSPSVSVLVFVVIRR